MHELAPLVYDLAIMLGVAGIVLLLFQRIHQPIVLGYLVAGIIIGPYTPPHAFVNDITNIQILSELGVIFLMFSLGLEFSFHKLTRVGFSASVIGLFEVILMIFIGYGTGRMLGWDFYDSVFLGAALSISSTTIIIKALEELKLKSKPFAELIFGILIVEDLFAILLLVGLSTFVFTQNIFSYEMLSSATKLVIVVGGWFLFGYFLVPPLFRRAASFISQETLTIVSVALCLFLVCVAARFHYSPALGAFIMGSILAETILIHRIESVIQPIRDIFAAVFFISVGMLMNPTMLIEHWPVVILISMLTIVGKIMTTGLSALLTGQNVNTSLRVGFGMAQVGEFSFIIAALGLSLNVTSHMLYPMIVAVSVITTFTTPYLIRFSGFGADFVEKKLPRKWIDLLKRYSEKLNPSSTSFTVQTFRNLIIRLVINAIMVAIIFTVADQWLSVKLTDITENFTLADTISLIIALIVASPFIWGMLFSFKITTLPTLNKLQINMLILGIWVITFSEVAFLSYVYFDTWLTIALYVVLAMLFFILSYEKLEKTYHWLERQMMKNIRKKKR